MSCVHVRLILRSSCFLQSYHKYLLRYVDNSYSKAYAFPIKCLPFSYCKCRTSWSIMIPTTWFSQLVPAVRAQRFLLEGMLHSSRMKSWALTIVPLWMEGSNSIWTFIGLDNQHRIAPMPSRSRSRQWPRVTSPLQSLCSHQARGLGCST
jgi:hypothetical protein